ncbi:hypothetical protein PRIPAC_90917 [Pristionchus pacificus]|uniref:Uncharacterized protein n=1 Tax=Pristionchus pacificus TaxID=54126 RepID=A0A2A6B9I3_PRIPA|nr:hypothetical protein PRIPAC_90917 [Pristionchus pacificus]|eukprot:PDM62528.1 hypothetical protein PRIPAC_51970 [Pristionchus pacificus]
MVNFSFQHEVVSTAHSEDVQAASTLKPSASARCFDKISGSNICHHGVFAHFRKAVARNSSTVRGGRYALSQVPGLSFRGRRPQARNGCAVPGRLAEPYIKFSLSSIAVDDPTTECATARLT